MWPLSCGRATKLEYFQRFSPPTTMFSPVADQSVKHGGTPAGSDPAVLAWLLQIFSIFLRAKFEGLASVDVHNSYCADAAYGKLDCTNAAITLSRQTPRFDFLGSVKHCSCFFVHSQSVNQHNQIASLLVPGTSWYKGQLMVDSRAVQLKLAESRIPGRSLTSSELLLP